METSFKTTFTNGTTFWTTEEVSPTTKIEDFFTKHTLHREDGPAVIYPDGVVFWWVNGEQVDGPYDVMPEKRSFCLGNAERNLRTLLNNSDERIYSHHPILVRTPK